MSWLLCFGVWFVVGFAGAYIVGTLLLMRYHDAVFGFLDRLTGLQDR